MSKVVAQRAARIAEQLAALKALARGGPTPENYYEQWLAHVAALLEAAGAQLFRPGPDGKFAVAASCGRADPNAEVSPARAKAMLEVYSTARAAMPPIASPTDAVRLLAPLVILGETRGVVELEFPEPPKPNELDAHLKLLAQACGHAGDYERARQERGLRLRQDLIDEVERFSLAVHDKTSVRSIAYAVVNDGRRLIGCDRAALLVRRGSRFVVAAVSGVESVETRSTAAKLLCRLAETAARTGGPTASWHKADDLPPVVRTALAEYIDEAHVRGVALYPLQEPADEARPERASRVVGVLVVEQIEDLSPAPGREDRAQLVAAHAATALRNALELESLPLLPLWRKLARGVDALRASSRNKLLAVVAGLVLAAAALKFVPADLALHAKATLQPSTRQHVFAPLDGVVAKLHVRHGDRVAAGQLLLELRNTDLDVAIADVVGRRTSSAEQLLSVERALYEDAKSISIEERHRLSGRRSELQRQLVSLDEQLRLLQRKRDLLKVTSPIAGEVTTWDVAQLLENRPVRQGQILIDVAATDAGWELELQLPENGIAHVLRAQRDLGPALPVSYRLAAEPEHDRKAAVNEVHYAAEIRGEEGNTILVRAAVDSADLPPLRPGAEATAKVYCGRRSLGYVWLHDVVDFVNSKILFRTY